MGQDGRELRRGDDGFTRNIRQLSYPEMELQKIGNKNQVESIKYNNLLSHVLQKYVYLQSVA